MGKQQTFSKTRRGFKIGNNGAKKKISTLKVDSAKNVFDSKNHDPIELVEKYLNNTENNRKAYDGLGQ